MSLSFHTAASPQLTNPPSSSRPLDPPGPTPPQLHLRMESHPRNLRLDPMPLRSPLPNPPLPEPPTHPHQRPPVPPRLQHPHHPPFGPLRLHLPRQNPPPARPLPRRAQAQPRHLGPRPARVEPQPLPAGGAVGRAREPQQPHVSGVSVPHADSYAAVRAWGVRGVRGGSGDGGDVRGTCGGADEVSVWVLVGGGGCTAGGVDDEEEAGGGGGEDFVVGWVCTRCPGWPCGCVLTYFCSGGVRGILELVLLQAIMDKVGFGIPIQELFDLVVGTSTGTCAPPQLAHQ